MLSNKIQKISYSSLIIFGLASIALGQSSGTPSQLRVKVDALGYLIANANAQTAPISQPTVFSNTRLKTDSNGYLQVTVTGAITPITISCNGSIGTALQVMIGGSPCSWTSTPSITSVKSGTTNFTETRQETTPIAPTVAQVVDGTGNCTAGTHVFSDSVVTDTGISIGSAASSSVTCDASHTKVTVTVPLGSAAFATKRLIYASKAGTTSPLFLVVANTVNDNTTTSYTFNIADASFTATVAPTTNTTNDPVFTSAQGGGFGIRDNAIYGAGVTNGFKLDIRSGQNANAVYVRRGGGISVTGNASIEIDERSLGTTVYGLYANASGASTTNISARFGASGASTNWAIYSEVGNIGFIGHLLYPTDNTYDIGASGATRPRTIYAGTSVISPSYTVGSTVGADCTLTTVSHLTVVKGIVTLCN